MTLEQLRAGLMEKTGLQIAYDNFDIKDAPEPPYLALRETDGVNQWADNAVWSRSGTYELDLLVKKKSPKLEQTVMQALNEMNVVWGKIGEEFDDDDGLFFLSYEVKGGIFE